MAVRHLVLGIVTSVCLLAASAITAISLFLDWLRSDEGTFSLLLHCVDRDICFDRQTLCGSVAPNSAACTELTMGEFTLLLGTISLVFLGIAFMASVLALCCCRKCFRFVPPAALFVAAGLQVAALLIFERATHHLVDTAGYEHYGRTGAWIYGLVGLGLTVCGLILSTVNSFV